MRENRYARSVILAKILLVVSLLTAAVLGIFMRVRAWWRGRGGSDASR